MTFPSFLHAHLVALYILLAALGLGGGALRVLRLPSRGMERLWLAWVGGLGLLSVSTLLLGMLGLLYTWLFAALLLPCALGGLWLLAHSGVVRAARDWLAWNQAGWFRVLAYLLILLSAGSVLWIWLTHALMPPHEWDEVAYHLTLARLYVEAHRIVYVPFIVHSNWPMNSEMLFSIALLFGSDLAPHLLMLSTALLAAWGLLIAGRRWFDDRVGIVAAGMFLAVPLVKRLAGTGLIDVALGMYVLAALVAFEHWRTSQQRAWLLLCGALCGFAAGSKIMGGAFPLLFGLLALAVALWQRPRSIRAALGCGVLFGMAGLLMVGPWYLRSWLFTGNPIYPFAFSIFGGRDWDALGDEYHTNSLFQIWALQLPHTPSGLLQSFWYMVTQPEKLGDYRGGIGVLAPVGALCAVLFAWRGPRIIQWALLVSGGFYLLWFAFVSPQLRFLLPIVPLLALAAAYAFVWVYSHMRARAVQFALCGMLIVLLLQQWPWLDAGERNLLASRWPYIVGQTSRAAWLDTQIDSMPLFRYANTMLPADARILLLPYENRSYYLDRSYIWGHPISQRVIRFEQFNNVSELAARLQQLGINYVIDNPAWSYDGTRYWKHDRTLMLELRDACGQTLLKQGDAVLYKLKPCQMSVATR
ncbi:MAG TPA: hypothetical protein VFT66_18220 [Roseiflexaceae bacterium]|nr:hypothetical protein [Roseiflexaceae bacterium]